MDGWAWEANLKRESKKIGESMSRLSTCSRYAAADSKYHVLAVDDSIIDRKLIERLLKTSSYQVTAVDSGSKALEFLTTNPDNHQEVEVNLVITDYCMPGMSGYELLKKIKESSSLRNIPVVIMSSENVPSRIRKCLEEGAEEFFLKPVQLSDLNKLKPHMLKTKIKHQKQAGPKEGGEENSELESATQEQPPQRPNNNKRKAAMEEGLSPDRTTRPRYNDIATVV